MTPILDASLFIAAISPAEMHNAQARAMIEGHPQEHAFLVPTLFRVEVMAALARRDATHEFIDTVDAWIRGQRFAARPIDTALVDEAASVARLAKLRAYDAVYVALALQASQPLWTLDDEVRERCHKTFPTLQVPHPGAR